MKIQRVKHNFKHATVTWSIKYWRISRLQEQNDYLKIKRKER